MTALSFIQMMETECENCVTLRNSARQVIDSENLPG